MSEDITQLEVAEPAAIGALEQMERASIDIQIATAKRFPRELSRVKQKMLSFATLDPETAAGCFYTLPARKGGDGKPLQGPSVRLAEIALASYQHLRAGSRIISDDGKNLTAQAVVHDLENNVCISIEVKRRITSKDGRRYSDDMVTTTGNAACSIALRNAAFRVIPLALVKPVYEAAKKLAVGDAKSLATRRADSLAHFAKLGVEKAKVFAVLDVSGIDDITLDHVETLIGYATAIRDGDTTVDEIFSPKPAANALAEKLGAKKPEDAAANTVPASAPEQKSEASTSPQRTEKRGTEDRDYIINELKDLMLTHEVSESKLWKYAQDGKHVPEGIDDLFTLPTAALSKLRAAVPALSVKKGGK